MTLKKAVGLWDALCSASVSLAIRQVAVVSHRLRNDLLLYHRPQINEDTEHGLEPPKQWAKINLFSLEAKCLTNFVTVIETGWWSSQWETLCCVTTSAGIINKCSRCSFRSFCMCLVVPGNQTHTRQGIYQLSYNLSPFLLAFYKPSSLK